MRERVDLKSPVREYRPPGSVRGAPGNRRPYLDGEHRFSFPSPFHSAPVQKRTRPTPGETCGLGGNNVPFSMIFEAFKLSKLCSALKSPGNAQEAYDAVLELGRMDNAKAVDLLIGALARLDGVSRSAARELGRVGSERAIKPLVDLLANADV